MSSVKKISDIVVNPDSVGRITTGYQELDWIFGHTTFPEGHTRWGMPFGKITLLSGESGAGKSRLCIDMAKKLTLGGLKILYFQQESSLSDFKGWVKSDNYNADNFYCSDANTLRGQLTAIVKIDPWVIFVDSINELQDFGNGTKSYAKNVINAYRQIAKYGSKAHVILLGQLNQNGSIKGSTTLPHLVDIALKLELACSKSTKTFVVKTGIKHRYGPRGRKYMSFWEHTENGVECISDYSLEDPKWCETHGISVKSPFNLEEPEVPKSSFAKGLRKIWLGF